MPIDLAITIVAMAMEGRDDTSKTCFLGALADEAVEAGLRELAAYVVADHDLVAIYFNQLATNRECVLRSETKGD